MNYSIPQKKKIVKPCLKFQLLQSEYLISVITFNGVCFTRNRNTNRDRTRVQRFGLPGLAVHLQAVTEPLTSYCLHHPSASHRARPIHQFFILWCKLSFTLPCLCSTAAVKTYCLMKYFFHRVLLCRFKTGFRG